MSKRGTDSQLTKDNYDQEDHDSGTQMGTFKMASVDELARRPYVHLSTTCCCFFFYSIFAPLIVDDIKVSKCAFHLMPYGGF